MPDDVTSSPVPNTTEAKVIHSFETIVSQFNLPTFMTMITPKYEGRP